MMNPDATQGQIRIIVGSLLQNAILIFVLQQTRHEVYAAVSNHSGQISAQVHDEIFDQLDANTIYEAS